MERRTALALATASAGTIMAASAAFAVNVGLLQHDDTRPVGVLDASTIESPSTTLPVDPTVVTVIVEDPPLPAAEPASATGFDTASVGDLSAVSSDDSGDDSTDIEREDDDDEPSGEPAEVEYEDDDD
ncbi:MAG: hypothetical protein ACT452_13720 [Microthrixaceae bacterium]